MIPCLKQTVRCKIIRMDGREYEATNLCNVQGQTTCPRVVAGCKTGEGYELCGSTHAEANAALLAEESKNVPGMAMVIGHSYICNECKKALRRVNVRWATVVYQVPPTWLKVGVDCYEES